MSEGNDFFVVMFRPGLAQKPPARPAMAALALAWLKLRLLVYLHSHKRHNVSLRPKNHYTQHPRLACKTRRLHATHVVTIQPSQPSAQLLKFVDHDDIHRRNVTANLIEPVGDEVFAKPMVNSSFTTPKPISRTKTVSLRLAPS